MNTLQNSISRRNAFVLFFSSLPVFFILYTLITTSLFTAGTIHPYLLFFGEKALLVLHGIPPRLENIGFMYPPLPVMLTGLLKGDVLLTQSVLASLISAFIVVEILNRVQSFRRAFPLIAYMTFSFPILYLATQRFDLYLYFFLVGLAVKLLYLYAQEEYSLYLFLSGFALGITFYTHFSSIYLMPIFLLIILFFYRNNTKKILPVSLVFLTPYLLFLLIFVYINWIFTSGAFRFLRNYQLLFSNSDIEARLASENIISSIFYMLKYTLYVLPVITPYILGIAFNRKLTFTLPFIVLFAFVYSNLFFPAVYISAIFIMHFLVTSELSGVLKQAALYVVLGISLIAAPAEALFSPDLHEKQVAHIFLGLDGEGAKKDPYQEIITFLNNREGKILLDDSGGYPLVYLMNKTERFILPYQYEFTAALSSPTHFADYAIAIKNQNSDLVYQRFKGGLKGFYTLFENEKAIIWGRRGKA